MRGKGHHLIHYHYLIFLLLVDYFQIGIKCSIYLRFPFRILVIDFDFRKENQFKGHHQIDFVLELVIDFLQIIVLMLVLDQTNHQMVEHFQLLQTSFHLLVQINSHLQTNFHQNWRLQTNLRLVMLI